MENKEQRPINEKDVEFSGEFFQSYIEQNNYKEYQDFKNFTDEQWEELAWTAIHDAEEQWDDDEGTIWEGIIVSAFQKIIHEWKKFIEIIGEENV